MTKVVQHSNTKTRNPNVLVIDVGGTHVKILATGETVRREFASGPKMTYDGGAKGYTD